MNRKYAALIVDIVGSKAYEDKTRFDIQIKMNYVIEYLNNKYSSDLEKPVKTVAGDEFQGLFKLISSCYAYARELQILAYPTRIRIGIGYGTLKYLNNEWNSFDIDGEAYYLARDAINCEENFLGDNIIFKLFNNEHLLINNYSKMCKNYSRQILSQGHLIYSALELYFPIYFEKNNFEVPKKEQILQILDFQNKQVERIYEKQINNIFKNGEYSNIVLFPQNNYDEVINHCRRLQFGWNPFEMSAGTLSFENAYPRGVLNFLELVVNKSKQNLSHHLNKGIRQSREAAISLIYFLKNIDRKENNL